MSKVVRQGDKNSGGGVATTGVTNVLVNNKPIVTDGTLVTDHSRKHRSPRTANGKSKVVAGNKPVNVVGNADTCGHPRSEGSDNVIIG